MGLEWSRKVGSTALGVWDKQDPNSKNKNSIPMYTMEGIRVRHSEEDRSEVIGWSIRVRDFGHVE